LVAETAIRFAATQLFTSSTNLANIRSRSYSYWKAVRSNNNPIAGIPSVHMASRELATTASVRRQAAVSAKSRRSVSTTLFVENNMYEPISGKTVRRRYRYKRVPD